MISLIIAARRNIIVVCVIYYILWRYLNLKCINNVLALKIHIITAYNFCIM